MTGQRYQEFKFLYHGEYLTPREGIFVYGVCVCVCVCVCVLSHVQLFATPWTVACQIPLSMGFSRQEYWSELPFPSPGDLPNPGIEPRSALQADPSPSEPPGKPCFLIVDTLYKSYSCAPSEAGIPW